MQLASLMPLGLVCSTAKGGFLPSMCPCTQSHHEGPWENPKENAKSGTGVNCSEHLPLQRVLYQDLHKDQVNSTTVQARIGLLSEKSDVGGKERQRGALIFRQVGMHQENGNFQIKLDLGTLLLEKNIGMSPSHSF